MHSRHPVRTLGAVMLLVSPLLVFSAQARTGGPDAFGYSYVDSDEDDGPVYDWYDISGSGTATGIADDEDIVLSLPFTFTFYCDEYTEVTLGDGLLLMGSSAINNRNQCLPANNQDGSDTMIMGLWDDLNAEQSSTGDVYYEVLGDAPDRMFVVQYDDIPHYDSHTSYSFEMILLESSDEILLQYASVGGPDAEYTEGGSATVGIQGEDRDGLEYSCETGDHLHDELAVLFSVQESEDLDGDGYDLCSGDCDESDGSVNPGATEADDGVDNDCDGLVDEDFVVAGDLVISEFLNDPGAVEDSEGEWVELYNTSSRDIDLLGWTLSDSGGVVVVDTSVVIPAGGYGLLAVDDDPAMNGGLPFVDWVFDYDSVHFNNTGDVIALALDSLVVDTLTYEPRSWSTTTGVSLYLDPDYLDATINDTALPWCLTPDEDPYRYGSELGTPGSANPAGLCCSDEDGDGSSTCDGDCDDADPERFPGNPELQDLLDNDCDLIADEDFIGAGDLLLTEFMDDPGATDAQHGEWFEVFNASAADINLAGWRVTDDSGDGFTIDNDLVIPAGSYAVFAVEADGEANGNLPQVDYTYGYDAFPLRSFDDDEIVLMMGDVEVDVLAYSNDAPWGSEIGRSNYLDPGSFDAVANDEGGAWCVTPARSEYDYGGGDYGTPGADNPLVDDDGDGYGPCGGDCDDTDGAVYPGAVEICGDGVDNDCDGDLDGDDADCVGDSGSASQDSDEQSDTGVEDSGQGQSKGGCSCRSAGSAAPTLLLALLGLLVPARRRRMKPLGRLR